MSQNLARIFAAGAIALSSVVSPVSLSMPGLSLGATAAHAAGKADSHAKPDKAKGHGKSKEAGEPAKAAVAASSGEGDVAVHGNGQLHAKLGGLNSLGRNINGLMNSSDPRMESVRTFIVASADLAAAEAAVPGAETAVGTATDAYDSFVAGFGLAAYDADPDAYAETSLAALQARLVVLNDTLATDPTNVGAAGEAASLAAAINAVQASNELSNLLTAQTALDEINSEVAAGLAATSDEMLIEALMSAANDSRLAQYGDGYVDPQLLAWAKQELGVGDAQGLIDDYISKL
ncbi:MAG: hypothetical protein ABL879_02280 [Devosia sp.]